MERPATVDLRSATFGEFVAFLFNREVQSEEQKHWYWHLEVQFDPETICRYYVQLFQQPKSLPTRFTKPQLEEGFWAIQGPNLDCSASRIINDSNLPFSLREECIRSMFYLFDRLFAAEPLETSVHMWWDSLCYDWHCGNRKRERGDEDQRLQDIFFQTLAKVLAIDAETCQLAALHGLGHLHHPETKELIDRFINQQATISDELKDYALAAAKFEVL